MSLPNMLSVDVEDYFQVDIKLGYQRSQKEGLPLIAYGYGNVLPQSVRPAMQAGGAAA